MANIHIQDGFGTLLIASGVKDDELHISVFEGSAEGKVYLTQEQAEQLKQFLIENF